MCSHTIWEDRLKYSLNWGTHYVHEVWATYLKMGRPMLRVQNCSDLHNPGGTVWVQRAKGTKHGCSESGTFSSNGIHFPWHNRIEVTALFPLECPCPTLVLLCVTLLSLNPSADPEWPPLCPPHISIWHNGLSPLKEGWRLVRESAFSPGIAGVRQPSISRSQITSLTEQPKRDFFFWGKSASYR